MKRFTPILATSILVAITFGIPAFAQMKGAEKLTTTGKPAVRMEAMASAKMNCPTERRTVVDRSARGTHKPSLTYTAHACPTCETKEVVQGAGKLATRSLAHSCANMTVCCKKN